MSSRVATFDLLRGYFLLVILVDHIARFPGLLEIFTGKGILWASAAEGFFLLSGIMVGVVRGKAAGRGEWASVRNKIWRRAGQLYFVSVALTLFFTVLAFSLMGIPGAKEGLIVGPSWPEIIWQTLTFQYVYGWADFLPFYAAYMAAAPLALWLLAKRKAWLVLVLTTALFAFRGHNYFLAWQVLFFVGIVAGYHWQVVELWLTKHGRLIKPLAVATLLLSATAVLWHGQITPLMQLDKLTTPWFTRWGGFGALRPVVALLWFSALYLYIRQYEQFFVNKIGWLLTPLGRNSLFAYGFQSIVIFASPFLLPRSYGLLTNLLINCVFIGIVWFGVKLRSLTSRAQRS